MSLLTDPPSLLDMGVISQDLTNCIATVPVRAKHMNHEFDVRLQATVDIIQAVEAGTLDNMNMGVIANRIDFGGTLPKSLDDFYILFNDQWILFQVRDVPDYYDPLVPIITVNLQSPHKGVG